MIDRVARPAPALYGRRVHALGRNVRPVGFPVGALVDPAANQIHLAAGQTDPGSRRGHPAGVVRRADSLKHPAPGAIARYDDTVGAFLGIESQTCLPLLLVRSVTGEALVGEQGPDVAAEIDLRSGARQRQS